MKRSLLYIGLLVGISIAFLSCDKKTGCTDPMSSVYDRDAQVDDGSCQYGARFDFWYHPTAAIVLKNKGITRLKFIANDSVFENNHHVGYGDLCEPECSYYGLFDYHVDMGSNATQSIDYMVTTLSDSVLWSGKTVVEARGCHQIELSF